MAPTPKKKHTKGRTGRRRGPKQLKPEDLKANYYKVKGIVKKLQEQRTSAS